MELPLFLIISFFKLFRVTFDKISVQPGEISPTKLRDLAVLPFHSGATIVESSAYNNRGFNSHFTALTHFLCTQVYA